jgi:hypothetical protein
MSLKNGRNWKYTMALDRFYKASGSWQLPISYLEATKWRMACPTIDNLKINGTA